ncbi:MAG: YIP1 family protein [Candidatus Sericytochromatia bacterium]|nr:YIP1 family protein [Candidatus Sericytochromatia bacterium]
MSLMEAAAPVLSPPGSGEPPRGILLWYRVMFRPDQAFAAWGDALPLTQALAALFFVAACLAFSLAPAGLVPLASTFAVALGWLLWGSLIVSAALFATGSLLGGRGAWQGLVAAVSFATLPLMLVGPACAWGLSGGQGPSWAALVGLIALLACLRGLLAALRGVMGLTGNQASLALLLAELLLVAMPVLAGVLTLLTTALLVA